VVIIYFAMLLILLVGMAILGFVAFDQVTGLVELLPDSATEMVDLIQRQIDAFTAWKFTVAGYTFSGEMITSRIDVSTLGRQAVALIQPVLSRGGSLAAQVARLTINVVTTGFLIFFVSLYMAKDSPQIGQAISNVATMPGYRDDAERLLREFMRIWDAYLRGQVILGIVIGIAVSLCLSLLGVNNALGLGILSGVLEFLPVLGPLIGAAAAVLVAIFQPENYWGFSPVTYAVVVLGVMILIQQVENNFLVPRIVGDALDLHPIVVMVVVIMGASLAGILGAVLAAPVAASIKLFGTYTWRKVLDLPPFPDPEPPPKPRRGQTGLAGRWRLWRMRLNPSRARPR
jgi:predicted PurR-regulated permease PerM